PPHAVHRDRGSVLGVDVPVNLREPDGLFAGSRHWSKHADQAVQSVGVIGLRLRGANSQARRQGGDGGVAGGGEERRRTAGNAGAGEVAIVPVKREEPEKLVLDERTAHSNTADSANVGGL